MRPIGRAIDRALRALGVDRDVARADAVRAWEEVATSTLGETASRTRAIRTEGGTLVVAVPTSQWAGEIRLRERELLRALAAHAPGSEISRIRPVPDAAPRH